MKWRDDLIMKRKLFSLAIAVAMLLTLIPGVALAYAGADELQNAIDSASDGATITLTNGISLDQKLTISDKGVTIDGGGNTITWADTYNGTLFEVENGASLILKNVTIDGENEFTFYNDTTTVEDGKNWYTRFVDVGTEDKAINADVIVNNGNLTLGEGTVIQNVTIASTGDNGKTANTGTGGYYLMYNDDLSVIKSNGGQVSLNGAKITGNAGLILNAINAETTIAGATIDSNMGCGNKGGIIIANNGTMTIDQNTSISSNKAMARSATILGVINGAEVEFSGTMDGNKHLGVGSNTAGAIVVLEGASQFIMNDGSISNNVGGRAGAIASRWVGGSYGQHEEESIILNSGTIAGNTTTNDSWNGASIFLRSPAQINEGIDVDGDIAVNAAPGELEITGGTFNGSLSATDGLSVEISGGIFSEDPSAYVADDTPLSKVTDASGNTIYAVGEEATKAAATPGSTVEVIEGSVTLNDGTTINAGESHIVPAPAPAPAPKSSGSGIKVTYNGGNSFSTSKSAVPTSVEIDGVAVGFTGSGKLFTVNSIPAGAKWVTVRWNSTSVTVNFTPSGAYFAEVEIPKTGDMPLWAGIAAVFGF